MTTLHASDTRIPPDAFNKVAYGGERIRIEHRGGASVVLVSEDDLKLLEDIEDRYWAEQADEALADMEAKGQKPIPWEETKAKMGL